MSISRRTFVKGTVAVGTGLALGPLPLLVKMQTARAAGHLDPGAAADSPAMLYDITRCAGCHLCEVACQQNKELPEDISLIRFRAGDPAEKGPEGPWAVRRHQCMHCLAPACVSACPVGAMEKTPEGPVVYHDERCLGCRYCMNACPFWVPTFDWDRGLLDGALIRKCNMCAERQAEGKQPACVEACPTGAVVFGTRGELLARAKELIAKHPDRYVNHVYGEHEVGGTSVLLLSGVPFEELGLPEPGYTPLPLLPEKVMSGIIPFALSWAAVLSGIAGLTRWRQRRNQGPGAAAAAHERRPHREEETQ